MLTPPAVRFVRAFDIVECRMVNVWSALSTQQQIDAKPMATELTVQAKDVETCLEEIKKYVGNWLTLEDLYQIIKSSKELKRAQDPIYLSRHA